MRCLVKILFIFFLSGIIFTSGQRTIEFIPVYGFQTFSLDKYYPINKSDSIKIENLKFYVSALEFIKDDQIIFKENESFHLLDVSNPGKLKWIIDIPLDLKFTHIRFNIGIDSVTNVSGALRGDLDPTLGMYWTWQSGYINVKVEGKSNLCKTRLNEFSLHLGGYISPHLALKSVKLKIPDQNKMKIYFDVFSFLSVVDFANHSQVMNPGHDAVTLSEIFSGIFSCK